jgi:hypothetical protein
MRILLRVVAILVVFGLFAFAAQMIAAEQGEVVVVTTHDAAGGAEETRLWVVDADGQAWLRAGTPRAGWYQRLIASPDVEVVRGPTTIKARAVPVPDARDRVNALMQEKYGTADSVIGMMVDRSGAIAIRLDPR